MMWSNGGHMGHGSAEGWFGMGIMVLFWIAVVIAIIYLIRYLAARRPGEGWAAASTPPPISDYRSPSQNVSSALRILEERYARGEIDQQEFLSRRADLAANS